MMDSIFGTFMALSACLLGVFGSAAIFVFVLAATVTIHWVFGFLFFLIPLWMAVCMKGVEFGVDW